MKKETLSKILLLVCISFSALSQKISIEKQISILFFDHDITKKPTVIEGEIRMPFDYGPAPKKEQNIKEFYTHPIFKTKYKRGIYNVIYAGSEQTYDRYGLYKLYIVLDYEGNQGQKEALEEYKNLVKLFTEYYPAQKVTTDPRDPKNIPRTKSTYFELKEKSDVPRLEIIYQKADGIGQYEIEIKFTTTYDFKKIKGMERYIFSD